MTCEEIRQLLDDRLDGELASTVEQAVDSHLAACAACREELRALEALAESARSLPRGIDPERDLWSGVEARIRGASAEPRTAAPWMGTRGVWLAAAAVLLLLVALPLARVLEREWRFDATSPRGALAERGAERGVESSEAMTRRIADQAGLARREDGTLHSRTDLEVSVELQRDVLSDAVVADLEENLRLLDLAVAELRTALEEDPFNRRLSHLLAARYQQEAELAQRMNRI